MKTNRFHIICDLANCKKNTDDQKAIRKFLVDLVKEVDMNVLAGPIITDGIPENPGITALIAIDYSHLSVHTFTKYNEALIDLFSCKPYDKQKVLDYCTNFFGVKAKDARIKEVWWGN